MSRLINLVELSSKITSKLASFTKQSKTCSKSNFTKFQFYSQKFRLSFKLFQRSKYFSKSAPKNCSTKLDRIPLIAIIDNNELAARVPANLCHPTAQLALVKLSLMAFHASHITPNCLPSANKLFYFQLI